jgi:hypothetical protein
MLREPSRSWVAGLLCAATLAGCTGSPLVMQRHRPEATPVIDKAAASATLLASYLEVLQRLVQGAPAEQAEILVSAQREYEISPTPSKQLKYALVLAAPNHAGQDLSRAQRMLRELLATPETLLPAERSYAFLQLQSVDRQLTLASENQRLQTGGSNRVDRDQILSMNRKLQSQDQEITRLRKALDEANAKLDAIANIEQSINERKSGTEGRSP